MTGSTGRPALPVTPPDTYPEWVARWTGEWLPGAGTAGSGASGGGERELPRWPGERLGLPASGVGSIAGGGSRLLALLIDLVLASLVTSLFVRPDFANVPVMQQFNLWAGAVWAIISVLSAGVFGFTPGMGAVGVRVARLGNARLVGLWRALVRCALTCLIVPAAVRNVDGRGWHDQLTGTVVVRMR